MPHTISHYTCYILDSNIGLIARYCSLLWTDTEDKISDYGSCNMVHSCSVWGTKTPQVSLEPCAASPALSIQKQL